jgi:hypothetical protein
MDGLWDWTVWNPNYSAGSARHGTTDSVQEAMQAAEQAAR